MAVLDRCNGGRLLDFAHRCHPSVGRIHGPHERFWKGDERRHEIARESEHDKAAEPKQKTPRRLPRKEDGRPGNRAASAWW